MSHDADFALIRQIYGAFADGDLEELGKLISDDIEYVVTGEIEYVVTGATAQSGTFRGKAEMLANLADTATLTGASLTTTVEEMFTNGQGQVIALHRSRATRDGETLDELGAGLFTVVDGVVTRFVEFFDDVEAMNRFWGMTAAGAAVGENADLVPVRAFYAAFAAGDLEAAETTLAPDIEYFGGIDRAGATVRGSSQLLEVLRASIAATGGTFTTEPVEFFAGEPGQVIVLSRSRAVRRGMALDIRLTTLLTVADGRIAAMSTFFADPGLIERFWGVSSSVAAALELWQRIAGCADRSLTFVADRDARRGTGRGASVDGAEG